MGSVGDAVLNVGTLGMYGAYKSSKAAAKAQQASAKAYAESQEAVAKAISSSAQAAPQAVQASTASAQKAAEADFNAAEKRKKTIASTTNKAYATNKLGSTLGRTTL